jgi:DNA polymerase V
MAQPAVPKPAGPARRFNATTRPTHRARSHPRHEATRFQRVEARVPARVPLMSCRAACGFPSPADDYLDRPLDFNELLIENPAATFAVRIAGDSMIEAGLFPNDIAIVDRSLPVIDKCIVLALLDGEFTIKRYRQTRSRVWLHAENPAYKDITITEDMSFEVWGVIHRAIRMLGTP